MVFSRCVCDVKISLQYRVGLAHLNLQSHLNSQRIHGMVTGSFDDLQMTPEILPWCLLSSGVASAAEHEGIVGFFPIKDNLFFA